MVINLFEGLEGNPAQEFDAALSGQQNDSNLALQSADAQLALAQGRTPDIEAAQSAEIESQGIQARLDMLIKVDMLEAEGLISRDEADQMRAGITSGEDVSGLATQLGMDQEIQNALLAAELQRQIKLEESEFDSDDDLEAEIPDAELTSIKDLNQETYKETQLVLAREEKQAYQGANSEHATATEITPEEVANEAVKGVAAHETAAKGQELTGAAFQEAAALGPITTETASIASVATGVAQTVEANVSLDAPEVAEAASPARTGPAMNNPFSQDIANLLKGAVIGGIGGQLAVVDLGTGASALFTDAISAGGKDMPILAKAEAPDLPSRPRPGANNGSTA